MEHHDEHSETNNVRDRLLYPLLLPVVCLIATVILIVAIGEFLLVFGDTSWTIGGQHLVAQVPAALALALIFLIGFAYLASRAPDEPNDDSH